MKPYNIEIENGIEYRVVSLKITEYGEIKKFIKELLDFQNSNPYFKFLIYDFDPFNLVIKNLITTHYMYKYQFHNRFGPALIVNNNEPKWYLNDVEYTEDEFVNEIRDRNLKNILEEDD